MNYPHKFIVLKIQQNNTVIHKVFATWIGGYLGADSWRMNSGIKKVEINDDKINFFGHSGSCYTCNKNSYGTSSYSNSVLSNIVRKAKERGINVQVLPADTNWEELFKN